MTTNERAVRPEVAALLADLDSTAAEMQAGDWHHLDGAPFTAAERALAGSGTAAEMQAAEAVALARADQATAAAKAAELAYLEVAYREDDHWNEP
jgi:hypothetical protein